jgi:hypothetical protein
VIERWLVAVRDHPNRPPLTQCHVLTMLALRMNWATGRGFASMQQLSADSGASEATVKRSTKWGRDSGHLVQVRRGHYISAERKAATVWQLTQPGYPQAESQPLTGELLGEPRAQNGRAKGSMEGAKGSAETHYQESVVLQESYSSARAPAERGAAARCPHCGRASRTGHTPGCTGEAAS